VNMTQYSGLEGRKAKGSGDPTEERTISAQNKGVGDQIQRGLQSGKKPLPERNLDIFAMRRIESKRPSGAVEKWVGS